MAITPVTQAVTKIIQHLKEKGVASPEELFTSVGAKQRTFYRALNSLLEADVIIKRDDGFFVWYEFIEYSTFENEFEAQISLNHSRNIAKGLKVLIGEENRQFIDEEYVENRDYLEHTIMHLKTGYPKQFEDYFQAERYRDDIQEAEESVKKRIRSKIPVSLPVLYPEHLTYIITEDVKRVQTGRAPFFLDNLKIVDDEVKTIGYTLAKKDAFDELRKFILEQEGDSENKKTCGLMINLGALYYQLRQSLEKEVNTLIRIVENGSPLRGKCQLCPKIKISSKKSYQESTDDNKN